MGVQHGVADICVVGLNPSDDASCGPIRRVEIAARGLSAGELEKGRVTERERTAARVRGPLLRRRGGLFEGSSCPCCMRAARRDGCDLDERSHPPGIAVTMSGYFHRAVILAGRCQASGQRRPCDERLLRISDKCQCSHRAIEIAGDGPFAGDASNDAVSCVLAPYLPGGGQSLVEGSDGFGAIAEPTTRLADCAVD